MLSAKLVKAKTFEICKRPIPEVNDKQVLLKVISCGICSSELPIYQGELVGTAGVSFRYKEYPADLGHEVVGQVVRKGRDVSRFNEGDFVTGLTYSGCGFSEFFIEDESALMRLPFNKREECIKYIGEPLIATINIAQQMKPDFGETICIIGDGFMSLLLVALLSTYPLAKLVVVGHHSSRLELAKKYGATDCLNNTEQDAWKALMDLTHGQGFSSVVEYAGNSQSLQLAASVCKPKQQAKLVLAAAYSNNMPFTIGNYLQNRAPVLVPAYPNHSLTKAQDMEKTSWAISQGIFPMEELVNKVFSLTDINDAHESCIVREDGYIKGIIVP